jgi:hypothetical protein
MNDIMILKNIIINIKIQKKEDKMSYGFSYIHLIY